MESSCQHPELAEKLVDDHSRCVRRMHPCARVAGMSIIGILLIIQIYAIFEYRMGQVSPGVVQPRVNSQVNLERQGMQHVASMKTTSHEYYWSTRMRSSKRSSDAPFTFPKDISNGPSWSWKNKLNEQVRHSPLIDNDMNIYVATTSRIRKFTFNGDLLWTYLTTPEEGKLITCPSLYKGAVVGRSHKNYTNVAFSLSMQDGSVNWKKSTYPITTLSGDADASLVAEDVLVLKAETETEKPNVIFGANATDGSFLWKYTQDDIFWNFSPAYNDDGTFLFSTVCGRALRMSLHTGEVKWAKGPSHPGQICGNSGGGHGGAIFFVAYNIFDPRLQYGVISMRNGVVVARQASGGEVLWRRHLFRRIANSPSFGFVGLSPLLAVPVGDQPGKFVDPSEEQAVLAYWGTKGKMRNAVYLLDATDGSIKWKSEDPGWSHGFAEFDNEVENLPRPAWPVEGICLPDGQTVPLIMPDGTVYSAGSTGGWLRVINDENHDGIIEKSEEKITNPQHKCFLNSPSAAPGMLVLAPCFGDVYVYKM